MKNKKTPEITMEDAKIVFRNFSGDNSKFNKGIRDFAVILDPEVAKQLLADGWAVKYLKPKDENDEETPFLKVGVAFDNYPAVVWSITSRGRTRLENDACNVLDWAEISKVDLIIRPFNWEVNGKTGIKAYVKSIYVSIVEDEFEKKYYSELKEYVD